MTEPIFTPETAGADIKAYENTDLSQLNTSESDVPATEKKLETLLVRIVFYARITAIVALTALVLVGLYGWTRNQTQSGWLMNLPMNTAGSPLCSWMNRGYDAFIRKDTPMRDFLIAKGKQSYIDTLDRGACLAPDTLAGWLDVQKTFASQELAKTYESIIPKKYLQTTITSSPELEVIAKNAPEHRIHHEIILQILSDAMSKIEDPATRIVCNDVRFSGLASDISCQITTRSPAQPRQRAIQFMNSLADTKSVLVSYPNTLGLSVDEKTRTLTTTFNVGLTYIPARYEAATIQNLTYDKR